MAAQALPKGRYHHGDLRRAVLDGALTAIAADGPAALSLRDVARRAGVSHAAPAHHFGDKAGVLTAIAAEGYTLLAAALRDALADGGNDLMQGGIAYIRFALEHRAHFEVMFRPELYRPDDQAVVTARQAAAEIMFGAVGGLLGEADEQEVWGGVLAVWSFTHGFATLTLDSNFDPERGDDVEAAVHTAGAAVMRLAAAGAFTR
ncbi:MAG: TetR/AcrR family transcriptional regulator [Solirubrobacteraceae bacterium]